MSPLDETPNKACPSNKWNNPPYIPGKILLKAELFIMLDSHLIRNTFLKDLLPNPISNGTICMDSRHDNSKHYNIHGLYSHYMIEATAK